MGFQGFKRLLLGNPLETEHLAHEKLPKWKALAVFASDALSSVAYATQEILLALSATAVVATALNWSLPIAMAIAVLLMIVCVSYLQTVRSYPGGGGAYIVTKENLGTTAGLVTAGALLLDYILTVSVSITAGVEAVTSAFPLLYPYRVYLCLWAILGITLINLRGVRESGTIFAIPTYLFIFAVALLLVTGFVQVAFGLVTTKAPVFHEVYPQIGFLLVVRAFSAGCTALTGVEAISDGVPAFRPPASRNAQITLITMAAILASFFLGITALSHMYGITPHLHETVVSQLAREVFGGGVLYFLVQAATALILVLAANTSFADFPRVCSFLAQDRFLPRQLASLGDRLVFSKGIMVLGAVSGFLVILFDGVTHYLIPLYAVGVFLSFTLSQSGMVRKHWREREPWWQASLVINGFGAVLTFIVLLVIAGTKFLHGAWIVIALIPAMVVWFRSTREHYRRVSVQLILSEDVDLSMPIRHTVVVPISGIHRGTVDAIKYAKSISKDIRVVYVEMEPSATERLKSTWARLNSGIDLVILKSPYRSVIVPILEYIRAVENERHDDMLTVVIPEFVTARWWENIYHNQTAFLIRAALLFERGKVVTSVRHHLKK